MANPKVSICLPNLNHRRFLDERMESILEQSFADWELIICDSYSDDGSWEFFQKHAQRDSRIRLFQAPRDGIYPNWNRCIDQARGDYIYVATSDDTFAPDCLEKLVTALDSHPECDLAHCRLRVLNESGGFEGDWWEKVSVFALSCGTLVDKPHIRRAPFDGLLHLLGKSVVTSITQLLIRKSLFNVIGDFPVRWGAVGDFSWNMRATLVADIIHVPDTWGGWRVHSRQATTEDGSGVPTDPARIESIIEDALSSCRSAIDPAVNKALDQVWGARMRSVRAFNFTFQRLGTVAERRRFLRREVMERSWPALLYFKLKFLGRESVERVMPLRIRGMVEKALGQAAIEAL